VPLEVVAFWPVLCCDCEVIFLVSKICCRWIPFVFSSELYYDRGTHHQFTSLVRELVRPGELMENTGYDFEFVQVEKPYESYTGNNVKLRYAPRRCTCAVKLQCNTII